MKANLIVLSTLILIFSCASKTINKNEGSSSEEPIVKEEKPNCASLFYPSLQYKLDLYFIYCMDICLNDPSCNPYARKFCEFKTNQFEKKLFIAFDQCVEETLTKK